MRRDMAFQALALPTELSRHNKIDQKNITADLGQYPKFCYILPIVGKFVNLFLTLKKAAQQRQTALCCNREGSFIFARF